MLTRLKLPNWVFKYSLASLILAIPLYPKFPFVRIPGTFVSIRLEDFLLVCVALISALEILWNLKFFLKHKVITSMILFLIVGAVSLISGIFLTQTVTLHIGVLHWIRRIEYFVPFVLGVIAVRKDPKNLEFLLKTLFITITISFVYGFGQRYFAWPIIITQNEEYSKGVALRYVPGGHINSTFAGHYDLATFLVLVLPVLVSMFFVLKGKWTKIVTSVGFSFGLWLLVNTASRISLASYLFSSSLALIFLKKWKAVPVLVVISLVFIGFSTNLLSRYIRLFSVGVQRVKEIKIMNNTTFVDEIYAQGSLEDLINREKPIEIPTPTPVFEDRSTNIRLNVEWPRAIRGFFKNPLLGTGYSSITLATDNDYLRVLGELGLLGFACFALIFLRILNEFLGVFPFHKKLEGIELAFATGVFGSLPGVFANAAFIDVFEASKFAIIFWLFIGCALGMVSLHSNAKNN